jgi:hypothetical protein
VFYALHPTDTKTPLLGAAGHITLIPANQLLVMGHIPGSLTNPGFEPATFQSLTQRANQQRYPGLTEETKRANEINNDCRSKR